MADFRETDPSTPLPLDRRRQRLVIPPCPECGDEPHVRVTVRTEYAIYVRCGSCGSMWSEAKPRPLAQAS